MILVILFPLGVLQYNYTCNCTEGYGGRNCDMELGICMSVICGEHGAGYVWNRSTLTSASVMLATLVNLVKRINWQEVSECKASFCSKLLNDYFNYFACKLSKHLSYKK